jgi:hypothetical protein
MIMPDDSSRPPRSNHSYDEPGLSPIEFMRRVMHAEEVPLSERVKAAEFLLPYEVHPLKPTPVLIGDKNVYIHIKVSGLDGSTPSDDADDPVLNELKGGHA